MTPEQWQHARELFEAALTHSSAERQQFLSTACQDDADVLAAARNLLQAYEQAGSFLEQPMPQWPSEAETLLHKTDYTGQRLGAWQILHVIGSGGMGEVYRARDTRLGRDVAIKFLPRAFSQDSDRLRRFVVEARATSAPNHPNILTIYDIGEHEGVPYLVAELLEGKDLRASLKQGALPVRKALTYAQQIAAGLVAAHDKGIVHRDLKPENLFVTKDGRIKILDFGIAKLTQSTADSATTAEQVTQPGTVRGTVGYMAPEQLQGQEADARTDLFAFGAVLYEMVMGQRTFSGASTAEVVAAILKEAPPTLVAQHEPIPEALARVVRHCLEKQPAQRFQTARDLAFALEGIGQPGESGQTQVAKPHTQAPPSRRFPGQWGSILMGVVIGSVLMGTIGWWLMKRSGLSTTDPKTVKRMTIKLPDGEALASAKFGPDGVGHSSIAISPDAPLLVYAGEHNGKSQLYLRPLDQFEAKPIPGTEGAYDPFFSPDGRQIGFFAGGKLKKASLQGGELVTLCESRSPWGASWGPNNMIVFSDLDGTNLSWIPASGSSPRVLFKGRDAHYPQFLPDGKTILFHIWTGNNPDRYLIAILSLETGKWRVLFEGGMTPKYADSGHLIFARAGAIVAAPFDPLRLEVTGPPINLVEGVRIEGMGSGQFALSQEGTLVYASGTPAYIGRLTWVDRKGNSSPITVPSQVYGSLHLSSDGLQLAVLIEGATNDVWTYEFARESFARLTVDGNYDAPRWTPDGKRIVCGGSPVSHTKQSETWQPATESNEERGNILNPIKKSEIVWKTADGSGVQEVLLKRSFGILPESWSPDGKLLVLTEWGQEGSDLLILSMEGRREPVSWLGTKYNEWTAAFSRDGRYIAYMSDESGRYEIYVRPYPGPSQKWQISSKGGREPIWSPDGRELFYREGQTLMAVAVQTHPIFRAESPRIMFEGSYLSIAGSSYDVAPDGQRFIMIEEATKQLPITHLNVVLNWFEELRQRVPAKGN